MAIFLAWVFKRSNGQWYKTFCYKSFMHFTFDKWSFVRWLKPLKTGRLVCKWEWKHTKNGHCIFLLFCLHTKGWLISFLSNHNISTMPLKTWQKSQPHITRGLSPQKHIYCTAINIHPASFSNPTQRPFAKLLDLPPEWNASWQARKFARVMEINTHSDAAWNTAVVGCVLNIKSD